MTVGPTLEEAGGTVGVAGLWTYHWSARRRPFLHPVCSPAGHLMTRDAPDDHPWHHGLWFAIKFVNDENFWEEMEPYGVVRHHAPPTIAEQSAHRLSVTGDLAWIRPDGETVVIRERRHLTHVTIGSGAYALDLSVALTPEVDVWLDRTPFTTWGGYGGLSLRGPGDWHDTRLLADDGSTHDRRLGDPGRWLDISGTAPVAAAEGVDPASARPRLEGPAGVAILDHPSNPRHPVPWYASTKADTYGDEGWSNFVNAAFLWDEGMAVGAGETLAIRHRVIIHDGMWDADRVESAYQDWAG